MKKTLLSLLLLTPFVCAFHVSAQSTQLTPLISFGSNGALMPGERDYLGVANNLQRGMAYNPITKHLLIASRTSTTAPTINIVDSVTGADLGTLPFIEQVSAGNTAFLLNKIAVADDGSIYVCNLTSASTTSIGFVLYRYASESDSQNFVFAGDPSNGSALASQNNGRWGDTLTVRGSGINTEILVTSFGTLAAILKPTDESLTSFVATTLTTDASTGSMNDGVSFGVGNTFWTKANGFALRQLSFDLNAGTATTFQTYPASSFPGQIGPILTINSSNLLAGIEIAPAEDFVKLYDITSTNTPVFLDRANYFTNLSNGPGAGEVCYGDGHLYAFNSDNGLLAFSLVASNHLVSPSFFVQPVSGGSRLLGSNVTFTAAVDGIPTNITYQWFFNQTNLITDATNTSLTISNLQFTNTGSYSVVASNAAGSVTSSIVTLTVVPENILYVYEPFNYTAGQQITDFTLAPGQTWTTNGSTTNDSRVASGSLSIPGLVAPIGNSFTNGGVGSAARLPLGGSQNSGALYASFAFRINALGTAFNANGLMTSFVNNSANDQQCRFLARVDGAGGYNLGIGKVTTSGVFATNSFAEGDVVFVVIRYTFVAGSANDLADLWLNPSPDTFGSATDPTPTVSAVVTGTDAALLDTWAYRQNTAANTPENVQYDELRIANKWALVTPLSAAAPISLTISRSGQTIILSWPVAGSTGFELESASGLETPISFGPVAETVVVQGGTNSVTLPISGNRSFFRLHQ